MSDVEALGQEIDFCRAFQDRTVAGDRAGGRVEVVWSSLALLVWSPEAKTTDCEGLRGGFCAQYERETKGPSSPAYGFHETWMLQAAPDSASHEGWATHKKSVQSDLETGGCASQSAVESVNGGPTDKTNHAVRVWRKFWTRLHNQANVELQEADRPEPRRWQEEQGVQSVVSYAGGEAALYHERQSPQLEIKWELVSWRQTIISSECRSRSTNSRSIRWLKALDPNKHKYHLGLGDPGLPATYRLITHRQISTASDQSCRPVTTLDSADGRAYDADAETEAIGASGEARIHHLEKRQNLA
ncbi:hypothetical protein BV22DRAFT_1043856 [Leucogyrophana mollusca]|uniref:Uncharacterized protein n=1 Tax=Leucogyrophana mollusca TaxID=85980 RepID=A0ACB8BVS9_9AGAM|nr:hypothetical protein BV22DRAFT_1043856 [Leucogyrophana mollusca]